MRIPTKLEEVTGASLIGWQQLQQRSRVQEVIGRYGLIDSEGRSAILRVPSKRDQLARLYSQLLGTENAVSPSSIKSRCRRNNLMVLKRIVANAIGNLDTGHWLRICKLDRQSV